MGGFYDYLRMIQGWWNSSSFIPPPPVPPEQPIVNIYIEAHPSTVTRFTGTSSDPGGVIEGNTKGNIIRLGKK